MIIGVPKEIKNNENRVALTPAGVNALVKNRHTVHVQRTAAFNLPYVEVDSLIQTPVI